MRLVLSNEFGHTPLVIDDVVVSTGESMEPVSALYHGNARWEIPAGQTGTSDPVPLSITAGNELVVSCFVAGGTEPATYLPAAQRTGEAAPGNQVSRRRLTGAEPFGSLYWIAGILVDAPAKGPVIVCVGDSITRGDVTTAGKDQRYPDHLQRRLLAAGVGAVVLNAGIGGNRLLRPVAGPSMIDRFDRDVLGIAEATHVLIMAGLNDIGLPARLGEPTPSAAEIVQGLFSLAQRARRHGIQPVLGTITPVGGVVEESFLADGREDIRQAVNHAIKTQQDCPVIDFAAAVAEPHEPNRLAFDSGDGLHPGDAGARALAEAVDLAVFDEVEMKPSVRP